MWLSNESIVTGGRYYWLWVSPTSIDLALGPPKDADNNAALHMALANVDLQVFPGAYCLPGTFCWGQVV